ncbi:RNA-directed DNA polymerase, eukaryota [Tanacetum coccineum]
MKSHLLGVGVPREDVTIAARSLGCLVMSSPFKYLGVMVGGNMSLTKSWDGVIGKLSSRLSKWKRNTLSIGGWLTLLKSVLGSTPIYTMSLYKVPKSILHSMESIRRKFFYGAIDDNKKITWVSWSNGHAISNVHAFHSSLWKTIIREVAAIKAQGVDLLSHCRIRVGNGSRTKFWTDTWIGDNSPLDELLFFHEKCVFRGGEEEWVWDLNNDGDFCVKEVRRMLDDFFLPKSEMATRWVKCVPAKVNVFAWRVWLDRLPTRLNLIRRNIKVLSSLCPVCLNDHEDVSHLMFKCSLASDISRRICCWWDLSWSPLSSYLDWLSDGSRISGWKDDYQSLKP